MSNVSRSLNLTQAQMNRLNDFNTKAQASYQENLARISGLTGVNRTTQLNQLNSQYMNDWSKGAGAILSPAKLSRYQQLQYQYAGFRALTDPAVQSKLNLTATQQGDVNNLIAWSNTQQAEIARQAAADGPRARQLYQEYQKQYQSRFNSFLTPAQQQAWSQLTGENFTFAPSSP